MTPQEREAFVDAYSTFVGDADRATVTEFVRKFNAGETILKGRHFTSMMDALLMWHGAIRYQLKQEQAA